MAPLDALPGFLLREIAMDSDRFTLRNDPPPKPQPERFETKTGRQAVLFTGLKSLPGQMDLFPSDGRCSAAGETQQQFTFM